MKPLLKDLSRLQLTECLRDNGFPAFRARQLENWLYQHWATTPADLKNLPLPLRDFLEQHFRLFALDVVTTSTDDDETIKWLARLADGHTLETVLIRAPHRRTVCISTQVGCGVRCAFCASGQGGLVRNLTPAEIIDQVILACRSLQDKITHVVVMGMGEPLHNFDSLCTALQNLTDPGLFALGARHITVSTSGIPDRIRALAERGFSWNLAVSLHAPNDTLRARIIPPPHRHPIADILDACDYYREKVNRMPTLEYTLVNQLNDAPAEAEDLAALARHHHCKVNLIPCNANLPHFASPPAAACRAFLDILTASGVQATLRLRKGETIAAACGQLRRSQPEATAGD